MKICTACKKEKSPELFGKRKHSKDGIRHECKECSNKRTRGYYDKNAEEVKRKIRADRKKDPTKFREAELKWYSKNHTAKSAKAAKWYRDNTDRVRARLLFRKYGITLERYNEILKSQNYCCAICDRNETEFTNKLAVDHNHKSKNIRGLLCFHCNKFKVGKLTTKTAKQVYEYLLKHDGSDGESDSRIQPSRGC